MATATFNTGVTDASGYTTLSGGVEASTGAAYWNGKYRSNPVGVSEGGGLSFRSVVKIPIDFSTLTGAVQITGATLQMRYFDTGATYDQVRNTGSRTVNLHRLLVSFTESPGIDSASGWQSSSTQNWNTKLKTAGTHYDSTVIASKALTTAVADNTLHEWDILEFIKKIAPASLLVGSTTGTAGEAQTNNGLLLKMSSTNASQGVEYYSKDGAPNRSPATTVPTIVLTYTTNTKPDKPVPTSPMNLDLQSGEHVNFSADFTDPDAGDLPSKFDLEISKQSDWSEPFYTATYTTTADPLTAQVPMNNFDSNINYYWRVRAYDTAGVASDWSDETDAAFTAPTNTTGFPPPEQGNPNFATTRTIARNKYRLEFYPLLASLNGFDPRPSAIIFDAKKIGVAHEVNGAGTFFFTVKSDHPQINFLEPMRTFWRACRWDEDNGFFRVMSEGLLTHSESYPNEVVFYGVDKLGMADRSLVTTENVGTTYSHVDVTLANLHDLALGRNIGTASITGISFHAAATITGISIPTTGTVRYTAANTFAVDELVTITGVNPTAYNLVDAKITAVNAAWFEVASTVTGSYVSGGTATPFLTGNIRFAANNDFFTGQVVSITGVNPTVYNLPLQTVTSRSDTWFEIESNLTNAWVSGGTATPAKTVMDMGWGESPTYLFRDYSIENGTNATATTEKSVQVAGETVTNALAGMADILMAGTTDKVIIEDPNIGEAAAAIDTMSVGLAHRHMTLAQQTPPTWWINYGTNVKRFRVQDNLNLMATRASIINDSLADSVANRSAYNGTTDPALYAQYGLIDKVERVSDERNDIDFTKQLQYNLSPDRLFTIDLDVVPNSIVPFSGYHVGDDLTLHIVDDNVSITKDLTLVAQQWIGNSNGAEYIAFAFAQKVEKGFRTNTAEGDTFGNVKISPPTESGSVESVIVGSATFSFQKEKK